MSDSATVRILGIAGSLRRGSFNAATLRAAQELAPAGMTIDSFDIAPIPLYNEDVRQQGFPPPVEDLRARIKAANGLLIVTPEYNYSIPGVLKNAIDWASRPPEQPFDGKPIGLMGASGGGSRRRSRAISPAAMLHLPQWLRDEPPGGDDPPGAQ
jgi:chromate reductase